MNIFYPFKFKTTIFLGKIDKNNNSYLYAHNRRYVAKNTFLYVALNTYFKICIQILYKRCIATMTTVRVEHMGETTATI